MKDFVFELGGEPRQLRFDMGTLDLLKERTQKDPLSEGNDVDSRDQVITIIFCGMSREHNRQGMTLPFTEKDVKKWVDDLLPREAVTILKAFNTAYSLEEAEESKEEDKKK